MYIWLNSLNTNLLIRIFYEYILLNLFFTFLFLLVCPILCVWLYLLPRNEQPYGQANETSYYTTTITIQFSHVCIQLTFQKYI